MRTVGMVVYGEVEHDARVRRAASALVDAGYRVVIASLASGSTDGETVVEGARVVPVRSSSRSVRPGDPSPFRGRSPGVARRFVLGLGWIRGYAEGLVTWRARGVRHLPPADVWIGHDLFGLWAADALAKRDGSMTVYDSHELFMEAGSAAHLPPPLGAALATLERRLARRASAVITVNASIAAELARRYGVRPVVVLNVPRSWRPPGRDPFAEELGIAGRDVILYHGALSPGRGIEQLVDVARGLAPERAVVILGDGPMQADLLRLVESPAMEGRLFVHPAVAIDELPDWVGNASVGVVAFQATTRNNVLATPNKLFDYLVAGVPVVASDFPEMRRILGEADAGLTCDPSDVAAIAAAIDAILAETPADRAARRARIAHVAAERFGWPAQARVLVGTIRRALGD